MDRLRSPGGCPWDAEQTPTRWCRTSSRRPTRRSRRWRPATRPPCARSSATSCCRWSSTPGWRRRASSPSTWTTSRPASSPSWSAGTRTSSRPTADSDGDRRPSDVQQELGPAQGGREGPRQRAGRDPGRAARAGPRREGARPDRAGRRRPARSPSRSATRWPTHLLALVARARADGVDPEAVLRAAVARARAAAPRTGGRGPDEHRRTVPERFWQTARTALDVLLEHDPVRATALGDHRFDRPAARPVARGRAGDARLTCADAHRRAGRHRRRRARPAGPHRPGAAARPADRAHAGASATWPSRPGTRCCPCPGRRSTRWWPATPAPPRTGSGRWPPGWRRSRRYLRARPRPARPAAAGARRDRRPAGPRAPLSLLGEPVGRAAGPAPRSPTWTRCAPAPRTRSSSTPGWLRRPAARVRPGPPARGPSLRRPALVRAGHLDRPGRPAGPRRERPDGGRGADRRGGGPAGPELGVDAAPAGRVRAVLDALAGRRAGDRRRRAGPLPGAPGRPDRARPRPRARHRARRPGRDHRDAGGEPRRRRRLLRPARPARARPGPAARADVLRRRADPGRLAGRAGRVVLPRVQRPHAART